MLNYAGNTSAVLVNDFILTEASSNYESGELVTFSLKLGIGNRTDCDLCCNSGSQHTWMKDEYAWAWKFSRQAEEWDANRHQAGYQGKKSGILLVIFIMPKRLVVSIPFENN